MILNLLGQRSLKSSNVETLKTNLKIWFQHWDKLWAHFSQDWWGRQRFTSYAKEQRTLTKIADDILGKGRSKIAVFGDGIYLSSI